MNRDEIIADAVEMVNHERGHLVISAALLRRRLQMVEEHGGEGMGYDFASILSLLVRMRDAIEAYRRAIAIEETTSTLLSAQPAEEAE